MAVGHTATTRPRRSSTASSAAPARAGWPGFPRRRVLSPTPRLTLVRPLLGVSRHEIRDYLAALNQPFREDASNADLSRTRARIRHDLLPRLAAEYNPQVAGPWSGWERWRRRSRRRSSPTCVTSSNRRC